MFQLHIYIDSKQNVNQINANIWKSLGYLYVVQDIKLFD